MSLLFFFGCGSDQTDRSVRLQKKKSSLLSEQKEEAPLIWKSPLRTIPLSFRVPSNFKIRFFEQKTNFAYSTVSLVQKESKAYPANISINYYPDRALFKESQALLIDLKKRDALTDVRDIAKKKRKIQGKKRDLYFFTHSLIFPPFSSDPKIVFLRELWLYFENKNFLYEIRLKSDKKYFSTYEDIFYRFLDTIEFK